MKLPEETKRYLDFIYRRYNKKCYIHPDPLEIVLSYDDIAEREIAAFIASCFALGRVNSILQCLNSIFDLLPKPLYRIADLSRNDWSKLFSGFRYRFFGPEETSNFFTALSRLVRSYGSLSACFRSCEGKDDETVLKALKGFYERFLAFAPAPIGILLANPLKNSACKRLNLFLRWMVRRDSVDPGGYEFFNRSQLIVPLDTHMFQIGKDMGLLRRNTASKAAALELTTAFREICREDPVRYDFCLSRFGIHPNIKLIKLSYHI